MCSLYRRLCQLERELAAKQSELDSKCGELVARQREVGSLQTELQAAWAAGGELAASERSSPTGHSSLSSSQPWLSNELQKVKKTFSAFQSDVNLDKSLSATGLDGTVAKSLASELVGTGFTSWYRHQPRVGFERPSG